MKSNPTKARKRVEATEESSVPSLVRGKDGSAFARWYPFPSLLTAYLSFPFKFPISIFLLYFPCVITSIAFMTALVLFSWL